MREVEPEAAHDERAEHRYADSDRGGDDDPLPLVGALPPLVELVEIMAAC